jgi:hypothetical protein
VLPHALLGDRFQSGCIQPAFDALHDAKQLATSCL